MTENKFNLGTEDEIINKLDILTGAALLKVEDEDLNNMYPDDLDNKYRFKPDFVGKDVIDEEILYVFVAEPDKLTEVIGCISFCIATMCTNMGSDRTIVIVPTKEDRYMVEMVLSMLDSLDDFCEIHVITYQEYNAIGEGDL